MYKVELSELCSLPLDCLICDDKHEWFLRFYLWKVQREHVIPLVNDEVVAAIQAQQQSIRAKWGKECPYLFPSQRSHKEPFKQSTFTDLLNRWAVKHHIKDQAGTLYHFTAHQFRHTLGMLLVNEDVPLEVVSRLLGHSSLHMTQRYARIKDKKMRAELDRVARKRKTVDYQGACCQRRPEGKRPGGANDP